MKTKLLKKLRKEAKEQYWIERWKQETNEYVIRSPKNDPGWYKFSFPTLEIAVEKLKYLRIGFILNTVRRIKVNEGRFRIDI